VAVTGRVVDLISKQPVSGIEIHASLLGGRTQHESKSGPDGRFTLEQVPFGSVSFILLGTEYERVLLVRDVNTDKAIDLGDVFIVKNRARDNATGRLGVTLARGSLRITEIDPPGPAAKTELAVGDVVTAIDGTNVTAVEPDTARLLLVVPAGTAIRLGLARGATITVVTTPRSGAE
jgi:hypothetical protein